MSTTELLRKFLGITCNTSKEEAVVFARNYCERNAIQIDGISEVSDTVRYWKVDFLPITGRGRIRIYVRVDGGKVERIVVATRR